MKQNESNQGPDVQFVFYHDPETDGIGNEYVPFTADEAVARLQGALSDGLVPGRDFDVLPVHDVPGLVDRFREVYAGHATQPTKA